MGRTSILYEKHIFLHDARIVMTMHDLILAHFGFERGNGMLEVFALAFVFLLDVELEARVEHHVLAVLLEQIFQVVLEGKMR